jgi:peptide/nickel transport system substrate-binding protein
MFKTARSTAVAVALCALVFSAAGLQAKVFKMANQGDVVSMDPYSLNESFQLSFLANVYDALVLYNKQTGIAPGLATEGVEIGDRPRFFLVIQDRKREP